MTVTWNFRSGEVVRRGLSGLGKLIGRWFRQAQRTFHLLVGLIFLFLSMAGAAVSVEEWRFYRQAPEAGLLRFALLSSFTVLLIVFCLYSFAKARSVR